MISLNEISQSVQAGKALETSELVGRALAENYSIDRILKEGLMEGMGAAEARYGRKIFCTPEILLSARAMNIGIKVLRGSAGLSKHECWGTVIIGTVKDDLYDIEKNIISLMLEVMKLWVIDLGVSVSPDQFIEAAKEEEAQIILCSAALISTMAHMKGLVQAAEAAGIRNRIKIMITGKPVTERYRAAIGADLYAPDMISAAEIAAAHCRHILLPAA